MEAELKAAATVKPKRGRPATGSTKSATSLRLSAPARRIMTALAQESGLSQASVVELALRDLAKRRGVKGESEAAATVYAASLASGGELTAASPAQEPLHDYSTGELEAMEAGDFQRPLQQRPLQ